MPDSLQEVLPQADQAVGERNPLVPGSSWGCQTGVCKPPCGVQGSAIQGRDVPPATFPLFAQWKHPVGSLRDDAYGANQMCVFSHRWPHMLAVLGSVVDRLVHPTGFGILTTQSCSASVPLVRACENISRCTLSGECTQDRRSS